MATEYITSVSLEPYHVDKDTGAPLSGGYVQFWKDSDRVVPKLVFQKVATGALDAAGNPVYEFVALPDPVQLSAVGTFQNAGGDNIAVYYYPFDADGNPELYYVAVYNSLGVQQFTREGWPGSGVGGGAGGDGAGAENMLSNSQFVDINFSIANGVSYTSAGAGAVVIPIAAKWNLNVTFTGIGTITITRDAIAGNANVVTNPPFALSVVGGANISEILLVQRLDHNPGIWSAIDAGVDGFVASHMILGPGSSATMSYAPSVGAPTQLLTGTNVGAEYTAYTATIQLVPSANTDDGDDGYVDIKILLSPNGTTDISSIQIVQLNSDTDGIEYVQEPVNRQIDHLFNYYNHPLQNKAIPSWLTAWDFPLNPAQELGVTSGPFAIGANKSQYIWDQTILFQSVNNGVTVSQGQSGALRLTAAIQGQFAIIQYVEGVEARSFLYDQLCSAIACVTDLAGGFPVTISLWTTEDASLPVLTAGTNNSLVATLNANGKPATLNGNWTEVSRGNLGDATFTAGNVTFGLEQFNGWNKFLTVGAGGVTYFAIVVGTGVVPINRNLSLDSVSLQSGSIATIPGHMTKPQVLAQCQAQYEKSFQPGQVPAQAVGTNTGEFICSQTVGAATAMQVVGYISYKVQKRISGAIVSTYNPAAANGQVRNETGGGSDCSAATIVNSTQNGFFVSTTTAGGSAVGNVLGVHWTCDTRLGLV